MIPACLSNSRRSERPTRLDGAVTGCDLILSELCSRRAFKPKSQRIVCLMWALLLLNDLLTSPLTVLLTYVPIIQRNPKQLESLIVVGSTYNRAGNNLVPVSSQARTDARYAKSPYSMWKNVSVHGQLMPSTVSQLGSGNLTRTVLLQCRVEKMTRVCASVYDRLGYMFPAVVRYGASQLTTILQNRSPVLNGCAISGQGSTYEQQRQLTKTRPLHLIRVPLAHIINAGADESLVS